MPIPGFQIENLSSEWLSDFSEVTQLVAELGLGPRIEIFILCSSYSTSSSLWKRQFVHQAQLGGLCIRSNF